MRRRRRQGDIETIAARPRAEIRISAHQRQGKGSKGSVPGRDKGVQHSRLISRHGLGDQRRQRHVRGAGAHVARQDGVYAPSKPPESAAAFKRGPRCTNNTAAQVARDAPKSVPRTAARTGRGLTSLSRMWPSIESALCHDRGPVTTGHRQKASGAAGRRALDASPGPMTLAPGPCFGALSGGHLQA